MNAWPLLLLLLMFRVSLVEAHEVHHRIAAAETVVITLTYANGKAFADEKYALYPAGEETPRQVGNTDAQGRIAFVPDTVQQWRVQAASADGHGINLEFTAPVVVAPTADTETAPPAGTETAPRWLLAGFGLSLIFGLFGLAQLFLRKKP